nr:hypothetical protein [Tanacetum cinerariifolium]
MNVENSLNPNKRTTDDRYYGHNANNADKRAVMVTGNMETIRNQDESNITYNSLDMSNNEGEFDHDAAKNNVECVLLALLITNLKPDIDDNKAINKELNKANMVLTHKLGKYK